MKVTFLGDEKGMVLREMAIFQHKHTLPHRGSHVRVLKEVIYRSSTDLFSKQEYGRHVQHFGPLKVALGYEEGLAQIFCSRD